MSTEALLECEPGAPDGLSAERRIDLDVHAPPGVEKGYHEAWKAVQESHPEIVWTDRNEGHWIALGGAALHEILGDHERFSSRMILIPRSAAKAHTGLIPTTIDPPEHRWYRKQLNDNLSLKHVRGMEDDIRALAAGLIDRFADRGHVDFTREYAEILPIRIFLALLDLPEQDAERLKYLADQTTKPDADMDMQTALGAIGEYLRPHVERRMADPGDDLLSRMVGQPFEGRRMTLDEGLMLAIQILIAGLDTVVNFLSFAMLHLAEDGELRRELAAEPKRIPFAVAELFRRYGLVTIARTVREDMDFRGVRLRRGDLVACPTVLHGIDARENECPMNFDMERQRARHSAFGNGPHRCPGQELARAEVGMTIEEWLKRIPDFRVPGDQEVSYGGGIVGHIANLRLEWEVGSA